MNRVSNRVLSENEIKVIHQLRATNPGNKAQIEAAGLKLKKLGDGLYREAFEIEGTELVVKVNNKHEESENHTAAEIRIWKRLLRSPAALTVPPLRYHNERIVVTDKVKLKVDTDQKTQDKLDAWKYKIEFPKGIYGSDMHHKNIGVYNNRFVVFDLGCFSDKGERGEVPKQVVLFCS